MTDDERYNILGFNTDPCKDIISSINHKAYEILQASELIKIHDEGSSRWENDALEQEDVLE